MTWLAICDRCGFQRDNHQLRLEWTGLRVCAECRDPRHPQEFVRGKADRQGVPWARPEPEPTYVLEFIRLEDGTIMYQENGQPYLQES